jgi:spermidine synthase
MFMSVGLRQIIHSGQTRYQHVQLLETEPFGRSLVLDGRTQSTEADEYVYHEALVQPVMMAHANPRHVFIAGGGEGATAREVLRHSFVERLTMVDLDQEVVELCKQHLPLHHAGSFDDPRLNLLHEDALAYLESTHDQFDIVIVDVPDPLEAGPAYMLYTEEFYAAVRSCLAPGGLMVTQSGPGGPLNHTEVFTAIHHTVAASFPRAHPYRVFVPSFGTTWGFVIGAPAGEPELPELNAATVDLRLSNRVGNTLRHYDGITHTGLFALPKYLRLALDAETRLITKSAPLYAV